jgi:MFS family permease
MAIAYGVYYAWPVFYVAILDEFEWSRADTALIFSTGAMVYGLSAPVSGALFDRFGPRRLFSISAVYITIGAVGASFSSSIWLFCIFFGILVAFGTSSAGFTPNSAMVSNWFVKRRATAIGIASTGTRESVIFLPLVQIAVLALGWRNAYLLLAAITVVTIIPLSLFLRARPQDMGLLPDGETEKPGEEKTGGSRVDSLIVDHEWASTDWTLLRALKEYRFWALFLTMLGTGITIMPVVSHHVAFVIDMGFTPIFASSLLTIYAIMSIIGRPFAFLSDISGREIALTVACLGTIMAMLMLIFAQETGAVWMLYAYAASFGFFAGLTGPLYAAAAADLFQGRGFGAIFGFINISFGMGNGVGAWFFGYMFDLTGSYFIPFLTVIGGLVMTIIAIWIAAPRKIRRVAGRGVRTSLKAV